MLSTSMRRGFAMVPLRAPESNAFVVQQLVKSAGQPVSYGETIALLKPNDGGAEAVTLLAPVHGTLLSVAAKVGDVLKPNVELAVFEGRKPLIEFRHLKGPSARGRSNIAAPSPAIAPSKSAAPSSSTSTSSPSKSSSSVSKTFLDLPAHFGRLPPPTAKEISFANSGGAYE